MKHVAIDLGASNGRIIVADSPETLSTELYLAADQIQFDVCHRFPSHIMQLPDGLHWDIHRIFEEIRFGLKTAFQRYGDEIASIAIDSWGVDFTIVDRKGEMLFPPFHYRDQRTDGVPQEFFKTMSAQKLYSLTGVQIMQLNTVFQLKSMGAHESLRSGMRYLSVPDLLTYWLSGEMVNERSHASTTGLFSPITEYWSEEVLHALGLHTSLFGQICPSATVVGPLRPELQSELGAGTQVQVIASASHDTQSAAYLAGKSAGRAFLSCGTWSILGIERETALLTDHMFRQEFSNEASAYGGYNVLKNIMGLWILQECKAEWDEGSEKPVDYPSLIAEAEQAQVDGVLFDVNDPLFLGARQQSGSMVERINSYRQKQGFAPLTNRAAITRYIIESLAQYYSESMNQLESITQQNIGEILLLGGGAQNSLLARLTSEKTGKSVLVGPAEATALGNIMIQISALVS